MGWGLAAAVGVFRVLCPLSSQSNLRVSYHPFLSEGVLESFHCGLFPKNASVNSCRQVFPWTYSLVSLGCETESGNVWGNCVEFLIIEQSACVRSLPPNTQSCVIVARLLKFGILYPNLSFMPIARYGMHEILCSLS